MPRPSTSKRRSKKKANPYAKQGIIFGGVTAVVIGGLIFYKMQPKQLDTPGYDPNTQAAVEDQGEIVIAEKWVNRRDRPLDPWMGLERGMTQPQVEQMFGKPQQYDEGPDLIRWSWATLPVEDKYEGYKGGLRVDFDAKTKLVVFYMPPTKPKPISTTETASSNEHAG